MLRVVVAVVLTCVAALASDAVAAPPAKPQALSTREEAQWVAAVKGHKTDDGATVLQVLQYAQQMRPREFKFGSVEVDYNGGTGAPDSVGIYYWLGMKRLPDDVFVNLSFEVKPLGAGLEITPTDLPFPKALQRGRDAFLAAVDEEYHGECIDTFTHRKTC